MLGIFIYLFLSLVVLFGLYHRKWLTAQFLERFRTFCHRRQRRSIVSVPSAEVLSDVISSLMIDPSNSASGAASNSHSYGMMSKRQPGHVLQCYLAHMVVVACTSIVYYAAKNWAAGGLCSGFLVADTLAILVVTRNGATSHPFLRWVTLLPLMLWPVGLIFLDDSHLLHLCGVIVWGNLGVILSLLIGFPVEWPWYGVCVFHVALIAGSTGWMLRSGSLFSAFGGFTIVYLFVPCTALVLLMYWMFTTMRALQSQVRLRLIHQETTANELREENSRLKVMAGYVATLAHEVRTPLNALLACCTLLGDSQLTAQQSEYVQLIMTCGSQLTNNVDHVLEFSRLQQKRVQLEQRSFEVDEVCRSCMNMVRHLADRKSLELQTDLGKQVLAAVGDPNRLQQVLMNLLTNAIKFTEKGFVSLSVTLCDNLTMSENGEMSLSASAAIGSPGSPMSIVRFEVKDTGIGMSPEQQSSLFHPFQQASVSTWGQYGGSGLGLVIVQQLVHLMGGEVTIDVKQTAEGVGSCFVVSIPFRVVSMEDRPASPITLPPTAATVAIAPTRSSNGSLPTQESGGQPQQQQQQKTPVSPQLSPRSQGSGAHSVGSGSRRSGSRANATPGSGRRHSPSMGTIGGLAMTCSNTLALNRVDGAEDGSAPSHSSRTLSLGQYNVFDEESLVLAQATALQQLQQHSGGSQSGTASLAGSLGGGPGGLNASMSDLRGAVNLPSIPQQLTAAGSFKSIGGVGGGGGPGSGRKVMASMPPSPSSSARARRATATPAATAGVALNPISSSDAEELGGVFAPFTVLVVASVLAQERELWKM